MKFNLSICAIFRGEGPYLEEWLEFHLRQGVEHFFLYNNAPPKENDKETLNALSKFKANITVINFPTKKSYKKTVQKTAYEHCLKHFAIKTHWLAIIDLDEFLFSPLGKLKIEPNCRVPYVKVQLFNYGFRPHFIKQEGGVVKNFLYRQEESSGFKSIIRGAAASRLKFDSVHQPCAKENVKINKPWTPLPNTIRINHYFTKSLQEFRERKARWNKWNKNSEFNTRAARQKNEEKALSRLHQVKDDIAVGK